ncbi:MAG: hypothetical protein HY261_04075 [Chloroflexi bacterium]|nr:hypothetical protein [Chloroflexota bacterium]
MFSLIIGLALMPLRLALALAGAIRHGAIQSMTWFIFLLLVGSGVAVALTANRAAGISIAAVGTGVLLLEVWVTEGRPGRTREPKRTRSKKPSVIQH